MTPNPYNGPVPPQGLTVERKAGWQEKTLNADMCFIHGGMMGPSDVRRDGLDAVRFGREWILDDDTGAPIGGGKLLFTFLVVAGNQPPPNFRKPAPVDRLWGRAGHCYVFLAPAGTTFYSQGAGQPVHGMEIAFPYRVESDDMVCYCTPTTRSNVIARNSPLGGDSFQMVPWRHVLAAQTV